MQCLNRISGFVFSQHVFGSDVTLDLVRITLLFCLCVLQVFLQPFIWSLMVKWFKNILRDLIMM